MRTRIAGVVAVLALCLTAGAFAGTRRSVTVELLSPATLNGKELPPGSYKVSWTGEETDLKVTFVSGKKIVAEAAGKLVERSSKAPESGVVSRKDGKGTLQISEIRFGGESRVLVLAGS